MIWCVEDDASIRDIEVYALRSTGFEALPTVPPSGRPSRRRSGRSWWCWM